MRYKIAVLAGDGIGPEVSEEGCKVLEAIGTRYNHDFDFTEELVGGAAYEATGTPLPDATLELCKQSDAIFFASVGGPKWDDLPNGLDPARGGILRLRKIFELYANLRPAKLFPVLAPICPLKPEIVEKGIDLLIVRELTGGLYFGEPRGIEELPEGGHRGYDTMEYKTYEIERIAQVAFEAAQKRRKHVTNVDKSNVLQSSVLWRRVIIEFAKNYPEISMNHLYIDIATMHLIQNPHKFDVIVTGNSFGDILSDEASVLGGSMGMLPSASLGDGTFGLYEPVHGSAPDIAGQGIANPIAQILSAAMMLRHSFNLLEEATTIENAVEAALTANYRTIDIALPDQKPISTTQMGDLITEYIRNSDNA